MHPYRQALCVSALVCAALLCGTNAFSEQTRLSEAHPELATGMLTEARLDTLPEGELLRAGDLVVTAVTLEETMAGLPEKMQAQAEDLMFMMLDGLATERILMQAVLGDVEGEPDETIMQTKFSEYMSKHVAEPEVTDEEIAAFYEENRAMMPDMALEQIRPGIEGHLKQQKHEAAWNAHVRQLGADLNIILDSAWTAAQAKRLGDNPVDKALAGDKPVLVNFGADWCGPCKALKPILDEVEGGCAEGAVFVRINVDNSQYLASRFEVSNIPLTLFFDKDGKETLRKTGVLSREEIVAQFKELGISCEASAGGAE